MLLDLTMPRIDGKEMLGGLRKLQPELPVLVMSGFSESEVSTRFAGLGASGFIQKPFHPRDLDCAGLPVDAADDANQGFLTGSP